MIEGVLSYGIYALKLAAPGIIWVVLSLLWLRKHARDETKRDSPRRGTCEHCDCSRAALLMHTQDDLSYEEISKALGISLAAAKVKVHRTRLKLNAYRMKEEESRS